MKKRNKKTKHRKIKKIQRRKLPRPGDTVSPSIAAEIVKVAPSTINRWLNTGKITGEQDIATKKWKVNQRMLEAYAGICRQDAEFAEDYGKVILARKVFETPTAVVYMPVQKVDVEKSGQVLEVKGVEPIEVPVQPEKQYPIALRPKVQEVEPRPLTLEEFSNIKFSQLIAEVEGQMIIWENKGIGKTSPLFEEYREMKENVQRIFTEILRATERRYLSVSTRGSYAPINFRVFSAPFYQHGELVKISAPFKKEGEAVYFAKNNLGILKQIEKLSILQENIAYIETKKREQAELEQPKAIAPEAVNAIYEKTKGGVAVQKKPYASTKEEEKFYIINIYGEGAVYKTNQESALESYFFKNGDLRNYGIVWRGKSGLNAAQRFMQYFNLDEKKIAPLLTATGFEVDVLTNELLAEWQAKINSYPYPIYLFFKTDQWMQREHPVYIGVVFVTEEKNPNGKYEIDTFMRLAPLAELEPLSLEKIQKMFTGDTGIPGLTFNINKTHPNQYRQMYQLIKDKSFLHKLSPIGGNTLTTKWLDPLHTITWIEMYDGAIKYLSQEGEKLGKEEKRRHHEITPTDIKNIWADIANKTTTRKAEAEIQKETKKTITAIVPEAAATVVGKAGKKKPSKAKASGKILTMGSIPFDLSGNSIAIKLPAEPLIKILTMFGQLFGKDIYPMLQNALLVVDKDQAYIAGTDLYTIIALKLPVEKVEKSGVVVVPIKDLNENIKSWKGTMSLMVKEDKGDTIVKVEQNGNSAEVESANTVRTKFPGLPDTAMPHIFTMSVEDLSTAIARTIFATTTEKARYDLDIELLEIGKESMKLVATDGKRLAIVEKPIRPTEHLAETTGTLTVVALTALAKTLKIADGEDVFVSMKEKHIIFAGENFLVSQMLSDARFPPYQKVMLKESQPGLMTIEIDTDDFRKALEVSLPLLDAKNQVVALLITGGKFFVIALETVDKPIAATFVKTYNAPTQDIYTQFNPNFLLEMVKITKDARIKMTMKDFASPGLIRDKDLYYLILPIKPGSGEVSYDAKDCVAGYEEHKRLAIASLIEPLESGKAQVAMPINALLEKLKALGKIARRFYPTLGEKNYPIIQNVKIWSNKGQVFLYATNLKTGVATRLKSTNGNGNSDLEFLVLLQKLYDVLNNLGQDEEIAFVHNKESKMLTIFNRARTFIARFETEDVEKFPGMEGIVTTHDFNSIIEGQQYLEVYGADLANAVDAVTTGSATYGNRTDIQNLFFNVDNGTLGILSTNAYVATESKIEIINKSLSNNRHPLLVLFRDYIIDVVDVAKTLKMGKLKIAPTQPVYFVDKENIVFTRKNEEPDAFELYGKIASYCNKNNSLSDKVKIDTKKFLTAIRAFQKILTVDLIFNTKSLTIKSGKKKIVVPLLSSNLNKEIETGYTTQLWLDILKSMPDKEFIIEVKQKYNFNYDTQTSLTGNREATIIRGKNIVFWLIPLTTTEQKDAEEIEKNKREEKSKKVSK